LTAAARTVPVLVVLVLSLAAAPLQAASLRGSRNSMDRQNRLARSHKLAFLRDGVAVRKAVQAKTLVRAVGNSDYAIADLSYPYALPDTLAFVEQLAREYRQACGERLVVTSLVRPKNRQPRNASPRTVHPTGMALDLRRSGDPACRRWLEGGLLELENAGILEATEERYPPHYHVALFPKPYRTYVAAQGQPEGQAVLASYRVRPGDNLWQIARRHGVSVESLRAVNGIATAALMPGQVLSIPRR
jgi:LysM domain-containing protein/uncharacterized protein DUF5715